MLQSVTYIQKAVIIINSFINFQRIMDCRICQTWYSNLINNIGLSATNEILTSFKGVEFKVFGQDVTKKKIYRRVGFFIDDALICFAENKMEVNKFSRNWALNNTKIPLGKYLNSLSHEKILMYKSSFSRTYNFKGEINAEIRESFYRFCPKICNRFSPDQSYVKNKSIEIILN